MVSIRSLVLVASASIVYGQAISSLEPCGQTCYNNAVGLAATFNCAAGDIRCMCLDPNFGFGIRDCAVAACTEPGYASTVTAAASAVCATATLPLTSTAATATTTSAPVSTAPATTSTPASTTSSTGTSTSVSSTVQVTSSTSSSTSSTSTAKSSTSSTTAAAATSTTAAADTASDQSSSIGSFSTATKIGLGVGVTTAVIAIIALSICALLRRRQNKRDLGIATKHWKISDPLPAGSGRTYANDYNHSHNGSTVSDLEMKSRRYEDMLPRQTPRQMV